MAYLSHFQLVDKSGKVWLYGVTRGYQERIKRYFYLVKWQIRIGEADRSKNKGKLTET